MKFLLPSEIVFFIGLYTAIYLWGIRKGTVKPVLATWLLFAFAAILSFCTDFAETGTEGIRANFFNLADSCAILIVLVVILCRKDRRTSFTLFERCCIGASFFIALLWFVSGQNVIAHLSIQGILFIAYIPTWRHLWTSVTNTESLWMWFFDFVASVLGLIEPLRTMSLLPLVYTSRAVICTLLVVILVLRVQQKEKRV